MAVNGEHYQKNMGSGTQYRAKNGTIQRIFEQLQEMNIIDNKTDVLCVDSTYVKVHPDGTGALKKEENKASDVQEED